MYFGVWVSKGLKEQPAAPIETFARFQAGFLSSADFHRFLSIVIDFMFSIDCWVCYACWACWTVWFLGFVGMEDCPTGSDTLDAQERSADFGTPCGSSYGRFRAL